MGTCVLPFTTKGGHSHRGGDTNYPVFKLLPAPQQKESKENEFLLDYIHMLPFEETGIPEYHAELGRDLGDQKKPNLIYPIGGGLYVHILPDPSDSRDHYIAIEPGMLDDNSGLVDELEDTSGSQTNRAKVLRNILNKIVVVVKPKDLKRERAKARKKGGPKIAGIQGPAGILALPIGARQRRHGNTGAADTGPLH